MPTSCKRLLTAKAEILLRAIPTVGQPGCLNLAVEVVEPPPALPLSDWPKLSVARILTSAFTVGSRWHLAANSEDLPHQVEETLSIMMPHDGEVKERSG